MSQAPTGTVTFLFTDIESSTALWQQDPAGMRVALEQHDQIVREAVAANHGYVFSTGGDGFGIAFASAGEALRAAAACQQRLAENGSALPLRVRMGMHTGQAEERGGNYFGLAPTRASRIMSAGAGGQILMSATAGTLARDELPVGMKLVDLGSHRLRGIERSESIVQAVVEGLDTLVGGLDASKDAADHVPAELDRFIGREADLVRLAGLLESSRLITLTGVGGSGKTRLAIRVARQVGGSGSPFSDGAWFCDLSTTIDAKRVPEAMTEALGVPERPELDPTDNLVSFLSRRALLLVVDNCEHLIDEVAEIITRILGECPQVRVLATSRELLGIPGESAFPVRSLALPAKDATLEELLECEAVRLFADRAALADPAFGVCADNAKAVGEICRRLDGMPLAIELAAARVRAMAPQDIAARLEDSFSLLVGPRTALPRHQTLGATIAWSHDLLSERERELFRRLSVFAGNFTLAAAEVVGADGELSSGDVADLLLALVDKSLVVVQRSEKGTGYRLLETVRQFGAEKLRESGEADASRERHANHYLTALGKMTAEFQGPRQLELLGDYDASESNIRTALDHLWGTGRRDDAFWLVSHLHWAWAIRRLYSDGLLWGHRAMEAKDADARARLHTLVAATWVLLSWGHHEMVVFSEAAVELATDATDRALALTMLGSAYAATAQERKCLETLAEAEELIDSLGDRWLQGLAAFMKGYVVRLTSGDLDFAQRETQQALQLNTDVGDPTMIAFSRYHLSGIARLRGELDTAGDLLHQALELFECTGDREGRAATLGGLAAVEIGRENFDAARSQALKAGAIYQDLGDASGIAGKFADAAWATFRIGDRAEAARLLILGFAPLADAGDEVTGIRLDLDLLEPVEIAAAVLAELGAPQAAAVCLATTAVVRKRHKRYNPGPGADAVVLAREKIGETSADALPGNGAAAIYAAAELAKRI
ncbi:MAG: hypothetical protein LJE84_09270 [Gammaproteobacteria bacterium]|jgi:predicted ATPase/class 3 adenylate cyclase|nr:hypothetical protein [Gammaproteobacteria bacterium]